MPVFNIKEFVNIELQKLLFAYNNQLVDQGDFILNNLVNFIFDEPEDFFEQQAQSYFKALAYIGLYLNRSTKMLDQTPYHDHNFNIDSLKTVVEVLSFDYIKQLVQMDVTNQELVKAKLIVETLAQLDIVENNIDVVKNMCTAALLDLLSE